MTTFTTFGLGPNRNPVLESDTTLALPDVLVGATEPVGAVGITVAGLLATTTGASDPDENELGIAITWSTSDIQLFYSLDDGASWLEATDLRDTSALLLAPTARVYALPVGGEAGDTLDEAFSFQLWDQTVGTNGDTGVDVELGPRLLAGNDEVSAAYAIASNGQVAYLATEAGIHAFDLIDGGPVATQFQDTEALALPEPASQLVMSLANGKPYLYARTESGIFAFDVSDSLNPVPVEDVAEVMGVESPQDMVIAGNRLFTTTTDGALRVLDISGAHPVNDTTYTGAAGNNIEHIAVSDAAIAFAVGDLIQVFPTSPGMPLWMGSLAGLNDIAVADGKVYVSSDESLYVADFQKNGMGATLEPVNSRNLAIKQIEILNGKLHAATNDDEVFVYDLQDMDDLNHVFPEEIDISSGYAQAIVPVGNRLYVANPEEGLQVIDLIGHTAFSEEEGYASLEITEFVNTAPELDLNANLELPDALAGAAAPTGQTGKLVSELLGTAATDIDGQALGIAVTGVTDGTLHYSLDNGVNWLTLTGTINTQHALLLGPQARVVFTPDADASGTLANAVVFKAWDQTQGISGDTGVDATTGPRLLDEDPADLDNAVAVAQMGSTLYTVSETGSFTTFRVREPNDLSHRQTIDLPLSNGAKVLDIAILDLDDLRFALVSTSSGVIVVDASERDDLFVNTDLTNTLVQGGVNGLRDMALLGNSLYTVNGSDAIRKFDFDASGNLSEDSPLTFPGESYTQLTADNGRLAAKHGDTVKVFMPQPFVLTGSTLLHSNTTDMKLVDTVVYTVSPNGGVLAVDVRSNTLVLNLPSTVDFQPHGIQIAGGKAYVTTQSSTVHVIDIATQTIEHSITVPGESSQVILNENMLYVANAETGLQLIDLVGNTAFSKQTGQIGIDVTPSETPPPPSPGTPPVVVPTTPVDGVPVQIETGTDGQQQITVPVVTPDRNEDSSTPNGRLADIAVVKNTAGVSLLNLGLPVGTGLTTNGPATTVSGTNAQSVLDGRITSASGSAEQKASAQAFLNSLPSDTQVVVQTVTVTAQSTNGGPLVISAANTQDGHKTVVVVDTRSLPAGTLIDLENVDFAVVVGDARVTGGAGANVAYGDDDSQFIVLGEDDDVLHGGGGNDTVGSLRGNDQVFGDAGNDVVYGGSGNDTLTGGTGNDAMNGGFGFDTGVQSGARADYTVRTENGSVILTHRTSGEVDRFTDVERITFDSGKAIVIAHEAGDVATLRAQYANDELIELNLTRAIIGTEGNDVITPELGVGRNIDLGAGQDVVKLAGGREDFHLDVEANQITDLTRLEDGAMLSLKNVELLEFANGDVTVLAQTNDQAILGRAYELLLGRNVDVEGFQFWAEALNAGVSLQSVLQSIVTSQEAATMYKLANGNFIEQLYVQGLDRASDVAGKGYWADALASGVSRAVVLEGFAGSAEAIQVIGSTIDVNVVS